MRAVTNKSRVPLYGQPQKYVTLENGATAGAVLGENLYYPNGQLVKASDFSAPSAETGRKVVLWELIWNVPPNVAALAATTTTGLYTITGAGTSETRTIEGDGSTVLVTDGDGVAGNPRITALNPYATYLKDENGNQLIDENGNLLVSDNGFPINPDYLPIPYQLSCGQEYLYAFHTKLMAGTTAKMVFSGDSTTEGGGTGATGDYIISTAMLSQGTAKGHKLTSVNAGHSGASSLDWITTYLTGDLASAPDLYVVRWGLNDPFYGLTITDFENNLISALTTCRAAYTVAQMSIVVMVPNTANDLPNGRDATWLKQVREVARRVAKDFLCTFIDTYSWWPDSEHAAGLWMDDTFGDGRAIHPKNVMNAWIVTEMSRYIFPAFLDAQKWGTYTPTLTNGANVASATPSQCQWSRTGNVVTVSGRVDIACTAAANTLTIVGMSLPVASNLTLSGNLAGGGAIGQTTYQTFICLGDTTNDRATLQFLSNGTTSAAAFFSFTYLVQ